MRNKIELHCHMDGSLSEKTLKTLANRNFNVLTDKEKSLFEKGLLYNSISAAECESLADYLKKFDLPCRLLQNPVDVEIAFTNLGEELANQGVKYAEIRFAPQLHSVNIPENAKLEWEEEIVKAAIRGINEAITNNNIILNIILCCMRNLPEEKAGFFANARTVYLASKYLNKGVCAVDLAGAEARDATSEFKLIFDIARSWGIPFTIHAGESGYPAQKRASIKSAIEFGAKRIGHGVGLMHSKELQAMVKDYDITVECCLKSNLDTKAVATLEQHPIRELFDSGVKVTLNTDNMTVSNTRLIKEYEMASAIFSAEEISIMQKNAFDAAFMTGPQRIQVERRWMK